MGNIFFLLRPRLVVEIVDVNDVVRFVSVALANNTIELLASTSSIVVIAATAVDVVEAMPAAASDEEEVPLRGGC